MGQLEPAGRQVTIAHAHSGEDTYVFVVAGKHGLSGSVHFPVAVLNQVLELGLPATEQEATAALPAVTDSIHRHIAEHLSVDVDGEAVPIRLSPPDYKSPHAGGYIVTDYHSSSSRVVRPARVTVSFDGGSDGQADLIVRNEYGWGRFTRNDETRLAFSRQTPEHEVLVPRPPFTKDLAGTGYRVVRGIRKRLRR